MMKKIITAFSIYIILLTSFSFCKDNLFINNSSNSQQNKVYYISSSFFEPNTNSKNIIVIDRKTLSILFEKNAYSKVAMASTTKIMTCIVAIENANLLDKITISKNSATVSGSRLGLKENSEITMSDLLYGLMLCSGNDCAIAIAEHISGTVDNYIKLMNNKAFELGLINTHFVTPHGLDDENHFSTAYDLSILTNYALKNDLFRKIVSTSKYNISIKTNSQSITKSISNTNELLGLEGIYGVKTGFTFNAGRCLVTSYKNDDLDIIIVVLGANTKKIRGQDTLKLINYVSKNFKYVDVSQTIKESFNNYNYYFINKVYLEKTIDKPRLKLDNNYEHFLPLKTDGKLNLVTKIYLPNKLSPKVTINKPIGKLYLYNNETLLLDLNIYLENELKRNSWKYYFKKILYYVKMP